MPRSRFFNGPISEALSCWGAAGGAAGAAGDVRDRGLGEWWDMAPGEAWEMGEAWEDPWERGLGEVRDMGVGDVRQIFGI